MLIAALHDPAHHGLQTGISSIYGMHSNMGANIHTGDLLSILGMLVMHIPAPQEEYKSCYHCHFMIMVLMKERNVVIIVMTMIM